LTSFPYICIICHILKTLRTHFWNFFIYLIFLVVLEFEVRASGLQGTAPLENFPLKGVWGRGREGAGGGGGGEMAPTMLAHMNK
jgi:hypothetical protein